MGQYSTANWAVEKAVWIPFTPFPVLEGQKIDCSKSIVARRCMAPHRSLTDLRLPAIHSMCALIFRFLHDGLCVLPLCCKVSQMLKKKRKKVENGNGNKSERQTAPLKKSARTGFRRQPREYVLQVICTLKKRGKKEVGVRGGGGEADGLSKF